jgi:cell wall-associated NlpC family hydrolase
MREQRRPGPRIMEQFIGKPYAVNGRGGDGYDCIGLVRAYLLELGCAFPDGYKGITLDNYTDFYLADRAAANDLLLEFFDLLGEPVVSDHPLAGDLCVVRHEDGNLYPGIYAGNRNMMVVASDELGVCILPLGKREIVKIRRPELWR